MKCKLRIVKHVDIRAITVPLFKLLFAPSRSVRVTEPEVVGFQVMVEALPAVNAYPPLGILNGLALELCAMALATRRARFVRIVKYIVANVQRKVIE